MHPFLARGRRLGLFLLVFAQAGVVLAEVLARTAGAPRLQAVVLVVPLFVVHAFTCLSSWYVCRRQPLTTGRLQPLFVSHASAGLLGVVLVLLVGTGWSLFLTRWPPFEDTPALIAAGRTLIAAFALVLYSLVAGGHYLYIALEDQRRADRRAYQLRLETREAELRALRAQVDPHFLFNSLNSINALVGTAPERARAMCRQLATFLRATLELGGNDQIVLEDEVALVRRYLEIEQIRFGDRLDVVIQLDPACLDQRVPALLLQPLVENAVTHGIAHCLDGGRVLLTAQRKNDGVEIRVENPCDPERPRPGREGFGLANVAQRLRSRYGRRATLGIEQDDERRFLVRLRIPTADSTAPAEADLPTLS